MPTHRVEIIGRIDPRSTLTYSITNLSQSLDFCERKLAGDDRDGHGETARDPGRCQRTNKWARPLGVDRGAQNEDRDIFILGDELVESLLPCGPRE